jgi:small subunit ribosomal protein S17
MARSLIRGFAARLGEATMGAEEMKSGRRVLEGRVISDVMDKTITVQVVRRVKHSRYHKYISRRKNYKAHDEQNSCSVGDTVVIRESRPLSRTKRWIVVDRKDVN